jgi:hypothetical protein
MAAVATVEQRYVVTARLAIIPDENQGQVYLMQDALVPTNLPAPIVQHLLDSHVISPLVAA